MRFIGEQFASKGLHADNVAPSLLGGLVLCPTYLLPDVVQLPSPDGVSAVVLHPDLRVNTAQSRQELSGDIAVQQWLEQQSYLATFVAACAMNDIELIGKCLRDVVIEPQRAAAVPCFAAVKGAAMEAGALGCSLSGSGPSVFALCRSADAAALAVAMQTACRDSGVAGEVRISPMNAPGARVES